MSKFQECMDTYQAEFKKLGIKCDTKLLTAVAKGCGPSIYRADASKVSSSDEKELATVKKNFLIKKHGLKDSPKLDKAISDVIEQFGKLNRNKYRAMFYYLLVKKLRLGSAYK